MTKHRSHSVASKRQIAEEFIAGETLQALSKRHDISRQLIRSWVGKFEAGALDKDMQAAGFCRTVVGSNLAKQQNFWNKSKRYRAPRKSGPMLHSPPAPVPPPPRDPPTAETIEIVLPDGCRLRVGNAVSTTMLRRVMTALRG